MITVESPSPAVSGRDEAGPRLTVRRWLLASCAFFLLIAAWAFAAPFNGTPDETEHIVRAAGVAQGQVVATRTDQARGSGGIQRVPAGLETKSCFQFHPRVSAACAGEPTANATRVDRATGAGRYFPLYYAMVGWPLVLWPGWSGVVVARLLGGALCAVFLGAAFAVLSCMPRRRLLLGGLLLATTPITISLAGAVNPSSLEIAAATAFFSALLAWRVRGAAALNGGLIAVLAASGVLMASLRLTGPAYVVIGLLAFVAAQPREAWAALRARRSIRWVLTLLGAAILANGIWSVLVKASNLGSFPGRSQTWSQIVMTLAEWWRGYTDQFIGILSWLDTPLPAPVYMIWGWTAGGLVIFGWLAGRPADHRALAVLFFGTVIFPSFMQLAYVRSTGFITQGRYMLPMAVGLMIWAAWSMGELNWGVGRERAFAGWAVLVYAAGHVVALFWLMHRYQRGLPSPEALSAFWPFGGKWHPVAGSVLPVVLGVAGVVATIGLAWSSARVRRLEPAYPSGPAQCDELEPEARSVMRTV